LGPAGNLNIGLVRRAIIAHHHVESGHSLAADDADFDLAPAAGAGDYRRDTGFHEIDLLDRLVSVLEHAPKAELDAFEIVFNKAEIRGRQHRKQMIV